MIKREHLKQAIDAIAAVDSESAYGLRELFEASRIGVPAAGNIQEGGSGSWGIHYYFEGERVDIPKTAFVAEGIATLEQSLILKLGELKEKQSRALDWVSGNVWQLIGDIRRAGVERVVEHELRRLPKPPPDLDEPLRLPERQAIGPHFAGHLTGGRPVRFMPLPLTRETLAQVAGQRFEFFSVRFLLQCWSDGSLPRVFACIGEHQVLGLVKLQLHPSPVSPALEIKYIARRMPHHHDTEIPPKGVGTFMLAGVWMLWRTFFPRVRQLFLDGEVGARKFYLDSGFRERRLCRYTWESPAGFLLEAIADLADDSRPPSGRVRPSLERLIGAAVKRLGTGRSDGRERETSLRFVKRCLMCVNQPYPATTAMTLLLKERGRIPEAAGLIEAAIRTGRVRIVGEAPDSRSTVLVVNDPRFALHLQNIFHLESPKRFEAFNRALAHPGISGRWQSLTIEPADREQLRWVHTDDYLDRLEKTAGRQLTTLDLDTQTTAHSWEVACLAVGGVFRLMDAICGGRALRGVAAVRPPGHHAEPDRAMGFCLLNSVALAARYLQKTHRVGRVLIVDLDAHHGNGTQRVFYEDDTVLFASTHGFPAYPGTGNFGEIGSGRGTGFTVNIPMARGAGDGDFVCVMQRIIEPVADAFRPEFILVSLGFDLYLHDRLGGMKVTPEGYGTLTARLMQLADRTCSGRIAFILEGGYSVKGIEACGLRFLQQLCRSGRSERNGGDPSPQRLSFVPSGVSKVIEIQKAFWPNLV